MTLKHFDRMILMCDGHIVFQGKAKDSITYFDSMGYKCGRFENPADFFMKILAVSYPQLEEDKKKVQ